MAVELYLHFCAAVSIKVYQHLIIWPSWKFLAPGSQFILVAFKAIFFARHLTLTYNQPRTGINFVKQNDLQRLGSKRMTLNGILVHKNEITNAYKETEYSNLICFLAAGKKKRFLSSTRRHNVRARWVSFI